MPTAMDGIRKAMKGALAPPTYNEEQQGRAMENIDDFPMEFEHVGDVPAPASKAGQAAMSRAARQQPPAVVTKPQGYTIPRTRAPQPPAPSPSLLSRCAPRPHTLPPSVPGACSRGCAHAPSRSGSARAGRGASLQSSTVEESRRRSREEEYGTSQANEDGWSALQLAQRSTQPPKRQTRQAVATEQFDLTADDDPAPPPTRSQKQQQQTAAATSSSRVPPPPEKYTPVGHPPSEHARGPDPPRKQRAAASSSGASNSAAQVTTEPQKTFVGTDLDQLSDSDVLTYPMRRVQVGTFDCGACVLVFSKKTEKCTFFVDDQLGYQQLPDGSSLADEIQFDIRNISRVDINKKKPEMLIHGFFGLDQFGEHYEEYAQLGAPRPTWDCAHAARLSARRSRAGPPLVQVTRSRAFCASLTAPSRNGSPNMVASPN